MYAINYFFCVLVLASAASGNQTVFKVGEDEDLHSSLQPPSIIFYVPTPFKVVERQNVLIPWSSSVEGVKNVTFRVKDDFVSIVASHEEYYDSQMPNDTLYSLVNVSDTEPITVHGVINMTAKFIGFNEIQMNLLGDNGEIIGNGTLSVGVMLYATNLVHIYQICLTVILVTVFTNMGANLDLSLVKQITKKPVGPAIGLLSQYVCMPLVSFFLGILLFPDEPLFRLGLFASGSAPGGGMSNMWTHLLGGSLDLSIMMTFVSTVVALGAVPAWLLTLGKVILKDVDFVIPYGNVLLGIALLILPCFVGIFIQLKFPRFTKLMKLLLTPLSIVNILFIFSFGVYTNRYLFSYLTWQAVVAGFGLTILGLMIGFGVGFIFRRPLKEMISISVETAVQNNGIAFLVLKMSLDKPAGDLAVLLPGCVGLFTPMPLFVVLLVKIVYQKISSYLRKDKDLEKDEKSIEAKKQDPAITMGNLEHRNGGIDNPAMEDSRF